MLTEAVAQALAVPVVVLLLAKRRGEAGLLRQGCRLGGLFREKGAFVACIAGGEGQFGVVGMR